MSVEIQIWIENEGRSYEDGLDILLRTTKVDPGRMNRLTGRRPNMDLLTFLLRQCQKKGLETTPKPEIVPVLHDDEMIIKKPDKKVIALKSELERKTKSVAYIKEVVKEKGQFFKEYLELHARLYVTEEGEQLTAIVERIKYIWDKEINPRWKIIDAFEQEGIIPEKVKSITIGKLFAELKTIPTKVSRINRLMGTIREKEVIEKYKLQREVHEREYNELEELLNMIAHVPVEMVKMVAN